MQQRQSAFFPDSSAEAGNAAAKPPGPAITVATAVPDACDACTAAESNAFAGLYYAGCHRCHVRAVSNSPRLVRERFYLTIADVEARLQFMRDVHAEFERRRVLAERVRAAA